MDGQTDRHYENISYPLTREVKRTENMEFGIVQYKRWKIYEILSIPKSTTTIFLTFHENVLSKASALVTCLQKVM